MKIIRNILSVMKYGNEKKDITCTYSMEINVSMCITVQSQYVLDFSKIKFPPILVGVIIYNTRNKIISSRSSQVLTWHITYAIVPLYTCHGLPLSLFLCFFYVFL